MRKRMTSAFVAATLALLLGVPALANDEQIGQQIVQRLQQHRQAAQLEGFNIGVQVENATVTMSGVVSTEPQAMLALDVARRVPGVRLVVNDLRVRPPAVTPAVATAQPAAYTATVPQLPEAANVHVNSVPAMPITPPTGVPPQIAPPRVDATPALPVAAASNVTTQAAPPLREVVGLSPQANSSARPPANVPNAARPLRPQPLAFARGSLPVSRKSPPAHRGLTRAQHVEEYGGEYSGGYQSGMAGTAPVPMSTTVGSMGGTPSYDNPQVPAYAWPSYAAYPNYAALTYPHQYSPTAWPYIGPFYPYPQVPLGWRKVMLEWDDGWWYLDFLSK